jgi:hypothetical protein
MMSAPDRMDIMSDMGSFYVSVGIESLTRRTEQRVLDHVLVDTGSELTWIPASLLGARSLEGMNLRVDARAKRLVPAGPIVTAAA